MKPWRSLLVFLGVTACVLAAENPSDKTHPHPIKWDAMDKTVEAKEGDAAAEFVFTATNTSDKPVSITAVRPSCGCTVVNMPSVPWVLAPGASGSLPATMEFVGREGELMKTVLIESTAGSQILTLRIKLPPMDTNERQKNQATAQANRQAVFRGTCVQCHVLPAMGKTGEDLFKAACLNCHTPTGRASMVPDLFSARTHRDAVWWRTWISEGREGTLMPAFAKPRGILTEAEIESLVEFALAKLPTEPRAN